MRIILNCTKKSDDKEGKKNVNYSIYIIDPPGSEKLYVPNDDNLAFDYYNALEKELPIKAVKLPTEITPEYVKSINVIKRANL